MITPVRLCQTWHSLPRHLADIIVTNFTGDRISGAGGTELAEQSARRSLCGGDDIQAPVIVRTGWTGHKDKEHQVLAAGSPTQLVPLSQLSPPLCQPQM